MSVWGHRGLNSPPITSFVFGINKPKPPPALFYLTDFSWSQRLINKASAVANSEPCQDKSSLRSQEEVLYSESSHVHQCQSKFTCRVANECFLFKLLIEILTVAVGGILSPVDVAIVINRQEPLRATEQLSNTHISSLHVIIVPRVAIVLGAVHDGGKLLWSAVTVDNTHAAK